MFDLIRIVDLEVQAHIGVPDAERAQAQRLLISLEMSVESFTQAAAADDLTKTVNYYDVAQQVKRFVAGPQRKLLETLAEQLAQDLLKHFAIKKLTLEIKKFILPDARWVSVEITRTADSR